MLDKSALRQGSSGRQTAGSGSTPCRTDGVRLGLTSQRLKTRSLTKQSITQAVWALLTNLPSCLPHSRRYWWGSQCTAAHSSLESVLHFTIEINPRFSVFLPTWTPPRARCRLPLPPPLLPPSCLASSLSVFSAGCCSRFILVLGLRGPRQAPQLFRWVCNYQFIKNDSFGGWSTVSSGSRGEGACQISSVSGNYLSPRLQFTILYLVAWQWLRTICWSYNICGIFTLYPTQVRLCWTD